MSTAHLLRDMLRATPGDYFSSELNQKSDAISVGLLAGTMVLTNEGLMEVENIRPGDVVLTHNAAGGGIRGVVWNTRRKLTVSRHHSADHLRPVCIAAGAFGPNVPERDVRLARNQAVLLGGLLYQAESLVNGTSIAHELFSGPVTYHQIELERPDVLLAENLPVMSFHAGSSNAVTGRAYSA